MSASPGKPTLPYIAVLIAIHLAIAVPLAYVLNIWNDEASSLYATQDGFFRALQTAATEQKQAPLYFWILSLWRMLNDSISFARLLSVVFSAGAIWLFSRLAFRMLRERSAFAATAFFALHPFLIWASLEIRVYALVVLLSLGLIYSFLYAFWDDGEHNLRGRMVFLALAIASLYTNYYLGFMLAAFLVPLILLRRWRSAFSYVAFMCVAGLAFLPMIIAVASEFQNRNSTYADPRSLTTGLKILWEHVLTFLLPTDVLPVDSTPIVSFVRLWIVRLALAAAAVLAIARWRRVSEQTLALGMIAASITGCLLVAYFLLGRWLVEIRHCTVLFAPLVVFGVSLLDDLFEPGKDLEWRITRIANPAFAAVVIASFAYATVNLYPDLTKRGDWDRIGNYIRQNERPDQPIIFFNNYDALALPYSYGGVNKIYPDERHFEFVFGTPSVERTNKRAEFIISEIPPDADELWLVINDECRTPKICDSFSDFIRSSYDVASEAAFYGQTVMLLRKKSQLAELR